MKLRPYFPGIPPLLTAIAIFVALQSAIQAAQAKWWKGNLHTHSLWSDGDDYPEMIVQWYKSSGYDFLALSDHNTLSSGQRWKEIKTSAGGVDAFDKYLARFGTDWVEQKWQAGKRLARLKPLGEFRSLFEEPGRFLLIESEEITAGYKGKPVHINATNIRHFIKPLDGDSVLEVMQKNINAVMDQRQQTGQPMFPHLNHPNFVWGVTAEELMQVRGERFFEVYNGHPAVRNEGDATHASTDRIWDIMLTWRIAVLNMEPIYGLGVDDSHNYHATASNLSNSGRGWVMVRANHLTPEHIVKAMEEGDFYASSGVRVREIIANKTQLSIQLDPEPGITYTTTFIGTRKGFDQTHTSVVGDDGKPLGVTDRYSDDVGAILDEQSGPTPSYSLKGDEIYVRAKIVSSKLKHNPYVEGEHETAWIQPLIPGRLPR